MPRRGEAFDYLFDLSLPGGKRGPVGISRLDSAIEAVVGKGGTQRSLTNSAICVDLSRCRYIELDATLRMIPWLAELKRQGNSIRIVLPELNNESVADSGLWSFLIRWRFFDALRRHVDAPENLLSPSQIDHLSEQSRYYQRHTWDERGKRTLSFTSRLLAIHSLTLDSDFRLEDQVDAFLSEYRDLLVLRALTQECGFEDEEAYLSLSFIAEEGLLNSVAHAQGSFALVAMEIVDDLRFTDRPVLILSVADNGVGIPQVLRIAKQEGRLKMSPLAKDDADLLLLFTSFELAQDSMLVAASTRRNTTTVPEREGMGLFFLMESAANIGARVNIRSGRANVRFDGRKHTRDDERPYYPGTTLRVEIPIRRNR